jgi:hypothetical protein
VESRKMVTEAIHKAQFGDPNTQTMSGEYKSGRTFRMEFSEFRQVVGMVLATRMRLTCGGCKSSLEIAVREMK